MHVGSRAEGSRATDLSAVTWMTCTPNRVSHTARPPGAVPNAASSNSGTVWPRPIQPMLPPLLREGHLECSAARLARLASPAWMRWRSCGASPFCSAGSRM